MQENDRISTNIDIGHLCAEQRQICGRKCLPLRWSASLLTSTTVRSMEHLVNSITGVSCCQPAKWLCWCCMRLAKKYAV